MDIKQFYRENCQNYKIRVSSIGLEFANNDFFRMVEDYEKAKLKDHGDIGDVMTSLPNDKQIKHMSDSGCVTERDSMHFGAGAIWCRKFANGETIEQLNES